MYALSREHTHTHFLYTKFPIFQGQTFVLPFFNCSSEWIREKNAAAWNNRRDDVSPHGLTRLTRLKS